MVLGRQYVRVTVGIIPLRRRGKWDWVEVGANSGQIKTVAINRPALFFGVLLSTVLVLGRQQISSYCTVSLLFGKWYITRHIVCTMVFVYILNTRLSS